MDLDISGDRPLPTSGRHGIDVASQRVDELDGAGLRIDAVIGRRNQILVPVASVLSGT
jgi:hypothetical protein